MNPELRAEFPALSGTVHGKPLVYLDTAASALKPRAVLDAERRFLETNYANVHRGVHTPVAARDGCVRSCPRNGAASHRRGPFG
jgi:cysteine desulfurase/selenocysteine lyase